MRKFALAMLCIVAGLMVAETAAAVDVQPVVNVIRLPQDQRGISLAIRNPREVPLPVTFDVVERSVAPDGSETETPADDEFSIFPAQAVLQPGQTQSVRVQYVGDAPQASRSFTLFSTEVPVDLAASGQSGVQRILRIGASIHVAPTGSEPKPVLESVEPAGKDVRVTVRNDGDRFIYVDNLSLRFGDKVVEGLQLANMAGRTLIPPGAKRTFTVTDVTGEPTLRLITPYL